MLKKIFLLINTVSYLKPEQIYLRIFSKFKIVYFKPNILNPKIRVVKNNFKINFLSKNKSLIYKNNFIFLNKSKKFNNNIEWNKIIYSKLWTYNLNYFDFINDYKSSLNHGIFYDLIIDWISNNKSKKNIGWESYPTSLRAVNFVKWLLKKKNNSTRNIISVEQSLYEHGDYLSKRIEYHLKGNHLITNAKALLFCGLYFQEQGSNKWLIKGKAILTKELNNQILSDGAHYELSSMYHSIILEDLVDIYNLIRLYDYKDSKFIKLIKYKINKMFNWLQNICHPNLEFPFFNDTALGVAQDQESLVKYANNSGLKQKYIRKQSMLMRHSGFAVFNLPKIFLILDVGKVGPDEQPGHAHADSLSLEMSVDQCKFIVNSGISTYEENELRHFQRSTAAHSTLVYDELNSSETWKSFRVARRADVKVINFINKKNEKVIKASHNGYSKILKENIIHTRTIKLMTKSINIHDEINATDGNSIIRFFLHPDIKYVGNKSFKLPSGKKIMILNKNKFKIKKTHWYRGFGKKERNVCIESFLENASHKITFYWK